jgi:hypothetical protein
MISVLNQMEMLDQEVAPPQPVAEQKFNLVRGGWIDLARRLPSPGCSNERTCCTS